MRKESLLKIKKQIIKYKKETGQNLPVIICECAYGNTNDELILMAKTFKKIVNMGGVIHLIK